MKSSSLKTIIWFVQDISYTDQLTNAEVTVIEAEDETSPEQVDIEGIDDNEEDFVTVSVTKKKNTEVQEEER